MLVYRDDEQVVDAPAAWRSLVRRIDALTPSPPHDHLTTLLIELGEFESAIADHLFPERDAMHPLAEALRLTSLAVGGLFVASSEDCGDVPPALERVRALLKRVPEASIPAQATQRISEGYAFYALHPETYSAAAATFAAEAAPASTICIGVRSIGTSLSAVVGAALARRGIPVRLLSVRPRGHPFDRQLRLDSFVRHVLTSHAAIAHYLVVDEGPGLSGSSFGSVARELTGLGIDPDRIVFFPGWDADGSTFRSEESRAIWTRHRRYVSPVSCAVGIDHVVGSGVSEDWSGGAWRERLLPDRARWPAVHPQHERVKRFLPETGELVRFAGLGPYGMRTHSRATMLSAGGFGPEPGPLAAGYLRLPFVPGDPCDADCPHVMELIPRYAAFLARYCPAGPVRDLDALHHMIETNCSEADASLRVPALASFDRAIHDAQATALDGRMLPHEFVRTRDGIVKTDALDHARDHFYPGNQDIAWDLAAAEAEFHLDAAGRQYLQDQFVRLSRDSSLPARLPFYRLAYAAFQIGYATMARQSLGDSPDGSRFGRRRLAFLDRLRMLTAG